MKLKLDSLEEQLSIDKGHISELENLYRKLLSSTCLDPKFTKVLSDLYGNSKDLAIVKYDRSLLTTKLQLKELRYHSLSKGNAHQVGY